MKLTTHVLDTAAGVPGSGIAIALYKIDGTSRTELTRAMTNADGRTSAPVGEWLAAGWYELVFALGPYFRAQGVEAFYDDITIRFRIHDEARSYHVPLLIAPWGYSTYRGS